MLLVHKQWASVELNSINLEKVLRNKAIFIVIPKIFKEQPLKDLMNLKRGLSILERGSKFRTFALTDNIEENALHSEENENSSEEGYEVIDFPRKDNISETESKMFSPFRDPTRRQSNMIKSSDIDLIKLDSEDYTNGRHCKIHKELTEMLKANLSKQTILRTLKEKKLVRVNNLILYCKLLNEIGDLTVNASYEKPKKKNEKNKIVEMEGSYPMQEIRDTFSTIVFISLLYSAIVIIIFGY